MTRPDEPACGASSLTRVGLVSIGVGKCSTWGTHLPEPSNEGLNVAMRVALKSMKTLHGCQVRLFAHIGSRWNMGFRISLDKGPGSGLPCS